MNKPVNKKLSRKDFQSDQEVRWCPGCGDYAILAAMQKTLAEFDMAKENIAIVSGIGCSSRFPYYMNTYGFHTIHGRAPAVATGLKLANPDLSVWVVTGDGDGLSIGGNHLIHTIRRNIDINIILFNNEIYGLTKGQYSPTSNKGTVSKSSPLGSLERPFSAMQVALGAGASFIARTWDTNINHMSQMFTEAFNHKGTSFIEIYQNCVIFNDGVFSSTLAKENKDNNMIILEEDKPLVFGNEQQKSIRMNQFDVEICDAGDANAVIHKPAQKSPLYADMLASLKQPDFPEVFGVLRKVSESVYDEQVNLQEDNFVKKYGKGELKNLLYTKDIWKVD